VVAVGKKEDRIMSSLLTENLKQATDSLAEDLLATKQFSNYERARSILTLDIEARSLLDQLSEAQRILSQKQLRGEITQEEIDNYRKLQAEIQENEKFIEYQRAQQAASNYLREINQEISQQLGLDFSALVGKSCG
jgi:cell fate (sporulation/competence/biofilm development) regulator YlbF (YheA/YmcA/DUF963 family)